jgi:hypothetical protein
MQSLFMEFLLYSPFLSFFLSFFLWMLQFADQSALFRTLLLAFDNAFVDALPPSES